MTSSSLLRPACLTAAVWAVCLPGAQAVTQVVPLANLNAVITLPTPFAAGDNLRLNTLVTTEVGALNQSILFTVGAGVGSFLGEAAWEVSTAIGTGPRLIGVNIDLFDAFNNLVASDGNVSVVNRFAVSSLAGSIGPGSYKLVATGTGVRDSSLDLTLNFISAVPEPQTFGLMLAGLGLVGFLAARRPRR